MQDGTGHKSILKQSASLFYQGLYAGNFITKFILSWAENSTTDSNSVFVALNHRTNYYIITIQKVEREWTPWNAKYYNMNHYFNNRR